MSPTHPNHAYAGAPLPADERARVVCAFEPAQRRTEPRTLEHDLRSGRVAGVEAAADCPFAAWFTVDAPPEGER